MALVTGAAGAISSEAARRLARDGFTLALADWQPIAPPGLPAAESHTLDVRSTQQVHEVVDRELHTHGHVDLLVNVAGITSFGSAQDLALDEWERVLDINLTGTFRCCRR